MNQKQLSILVASALIAGAIGYLVLQERGEIGEMRVQAISGTVTVTRDGAEQEVEDQLTIEPGDSIRTSGGGLAKLRLAGDRLAWMATGSRVAVVDRGSLEIETGHLLAQAEDPIQVAFDGVSAHADQGTFRIDQGAGSSRAAVYEGSVRLAAPGQARRSLASLFEAQISAGRLPQRVRPLQLRGGEWDLSNVPRDEVPALAHLNEILELDEDLTRRGDGLESQLGNARPGLPYFRSLAGRNVGFMKPLLKRPVKELLIGFTIAKNGNSSLKKEMRRTFKLRDEGGRWGVVAAIQEANPKILIGDLGELIIAATGGEDGSGGPGIGEASFTLAAAGGGPLPPGSPGSPTGGGPDGPTNPRGPKPPTDGEDPEDPEECEGSSIDCGIQEVTKHVPRPSPSPSDPPLLNLP